MQAILTISILGYDLSFGLGMDVEKSDKEEAKEVLVVESTGAHERVVGFVRAEEEEDRG